MPEASKELWTEEQISEIIVHLRAWINVPWRHQGRSKTGVDCVGYFACVSEEMGRPEVIPTNYSRNPDSKLMLAEFRKRFDEIQDWRESGIHRGDFLIMKFMDTNKRMSPRHVAMRTDLGIIHAAAQYKKVTEHTFDDEWRSKVEYVFRIRKTTA